ncbi:hypothetical protein NF865_03110 [Thermococcus aggregans]|uniref:Uncharacterized protein n=1 Tax=Thermococcus aggregans TaxID=110163 RepID=A0A9E7MYC8_THEAG|nr:hypothetical protein [Thermococcus aggregans]USS41206.1 hypothetical protein NF865_03110 [Thermococcus aggregans]
MNAKTLVEMLSRLQSLIAEGSLEIKVGDNFITISRDEVIADISSPEEITKLAKALKESMKSDITKTVKSIPDVMRLIAEVGEELSEERKTLIIKYRGRDVVIMGFKANPGILGMNNVEIKDKLGLMKLLSALL